MSRPSHGSLSAKLGRVPQAFLNAGFVFALVLAAGCLLLSALYLFTFLRSTGVGIEPLADNLRTQPGALEVIINGRLVMTRLSLLSCGIFVGIAFGFLGFGLCLLGVKESIDVDMESQSYKARFVRMSPGVLIIVCSSLLTGFCATRETPFWYENTVNAQSEETTGREKESTRRALPEQSKEFSKSP